MDMSFLLSNLWALWLITALVFLVIEIGTVSLVSIWFVCGAAAAAVCACFWDSFAGQIAVFCVSSVVFLLIFKKIYGRKTANRSTVSDDIASSVVGRAGKAAERITPLCGSVKLGDVYWKAVCRDENGIEKGTPVTVTGMDGTTLIVEKGHHKV